MSGARVRAERPDDRTAVAELLARAFPTPAEAALVEALRGRTPRQIARVAELGDAGVVGHILFTPVAIGGGPDPPRAVGLGPMAVDPAHQRRGIGGALVTAGLAACREEGERIVVVLGHPAYYPRFGFLPAWDHGLYYAEPGPDPAFFVQELAPGALAGAEGEVHYHAAFAGL